MINIIRPFTPSGRHTDPVPGHTKLLGGSVVRLGGRGGRLAQPGPGRVDMQVGTSDGPLGRSSP